MPWRSRPTAGPWRAPTWTSRSASGTSRPASSRVGSTRGSAGSRRWPSPRTDGGSPSAVGTARCRYACWSRRPRRSGRTPLDERPPAGDSVGKARRCSSIFVTRLFGDLARMGRHEADSLDTCRLVDLARSGDGPALGLLLERYRNYLSLLARVQIGRRMQGKLDVADVV